VFTDIDSVDLSEFHRRAAPTYSLPEGVELFIKEGTWRMRAVPRWMSPEGLPVSEFARLVIDTSGYYRIESDFLHDVFEKRLFRGVDVEDLARIMRKHLPEMTVAVI